MAALTGFAPVSLGLKGRDPDMLDDKAEWSADERDVGITFRARCWTLTKREHAAGIAV